MNTYTISYRFSQDGQGWNLCFSDFKALCDADALEQFHTKYDGLYNYLQIKTIECN